MSGTHPPIVGSNTNTALATHWHGHWRTEQDTQAFASALAAALPTWPGGQDACIELQGNLGAGKTTLVRHLLRAAGVQGRIKSPTYAVVEPHEAQGPQGLWPVWHFDFYRFSDPQEWEDAGFRDIFAGPGLKLMEWPEKVAGQLPKADWVIQLEVTSDDVRNVSIQAQTERGQQWLAQWGQLAHGV